MVLHSRRPPGEGSAVQIAADATLWLAHPLSKAVLLSMWPGFDPELRRQLDHVRQMVARSHQTPTREWPLTFVDEHNALLVVREWPDGALTSYYAHPKSGSSRNAD